MGGQLTQLYPFKEINNLPGRIPIKAKNYVTELKAQLEETNVKVRLNTKINIVYEGSDCVKVESGNAESTSHGSLAFGKGMHRCLGEPLVGKFIKELYPVLLSYSDTLTCISFDTNSEFGFFTFTKLLIKYREK